MPSHNGTGKCARSKKASMAPTFLLARPVPWDTLRAPMHKPCQPRPCKIHAQTGANVGSALAVTSGILLTNTFCPECTHPEHIRGNWLYSNSIPPVGPVTMRIVLPFWHEMHISMLICMEKQPCTLRRYLACSSFTTSMAISQARLVIYALVRRVPG